MWCPHFPHLYSVSSLLYLGMFLQFYGKVGKGWKREFLQYSASSFCHLAYSMVHFREKIPRMLFEIPGSTCSKYPKRSRLPVIGIVWWPSSCIYEESDCFRISPYFLHIDPFTNPSPKGLLPLSRIPLGMGQCQFSAVLEGHPAIPAIFMFTSIPGYWS